MSETSLLRARLNTWARAYRLELSLFAIALIVRLLLIAAVPHEQLATYWIGFDGADYVQEAQNILDGHGFTRSLAPPYLPEVLKTPLYPLALAGVHLLTGSFVAIVIFEAFLSSVLPVLAVALGRFFIRRRSVLIALGLFFVFEPHLVFSTIFFGTEGISVVLTAWGLYEVIAARYTNRPRYHLALAGLAFGLATLARPITYYLPGFLLCLFALEAFWTARWRYWLSAFGVFFVVFAIVVSPWVVRNYAVFGVADISTASWFNIYTRLAATVQATDTGDDFYTSYTKLLNELYVRGYVTHPLGISESEDLEITEVRFTPILRTESLRILREHPRAFVIYLATVPFSVLTQTNLLGYISSFVPLQYDHPSFSPTLYASQHGVIALVKAIAPYLFGPYIVPYLVRALLLALFAFSIAGAWILWRENDRFATLFLFGFMLYLVALTASAGAQIGDRHRAPFLLAEATLAAVALERMIDRRKGSTIVA